MRSPNRPPPAIPFYASPASRSRLSLRNRGTTTLRIRYDILLHIQIIQHIEIRIQVVILVQGLQIAHRRARAGIRKFRNRNVRPGSLNQLLRVTNNPTPIPISTVSAAASTGRRNHCNQPACGLAISSRRPSLQPHVKVLRRLRSLPLVQQRHGSAHLFQLFRTRSASRQMLALVRCGRSESCGHIGHPFANVIAIAVHNPSP